MTEITMETVEKIGILSTSPTGWTKEFRVVDWNARGPRYDLREWAPGDRQVSRGITLSLKEIRALQEMLVEIEFPEVGEDDDDLGGADSALMEAAAPEAYKPARGAARKAG